MDTEKLLNTPLEQLHIKHRAKMVAFAGYHMPLHYPAGIIQEHQYCRSQCCLFDISHMGQLQLSGTHVVSFLEKLSPGKISSLQSGQQRYSVFTNTRGGIIDDFIISRFKTAYHLIINASQRRTISELLHLRIEGDCKLDLLYKDALLALQGPEAVNILKALVPECADMSFMSARELQIEDIPCRIFRSGYTGEDGFEIAIAADHATKLANLILENPKVRLAGLGARDTLRLEAGLCLYGQDLTTSISPVEAGLAWTLRKHGNDYPGSNLIEMQLNDGPSRKRIGLLPDGKALIRAETPLFDAADKEIGFVSSGGYSPNLQRPIAMAYVDRLMAQEGNTVFANVHGRSVSAVLCKLPFHPHKFHRPSL